MSAPTHVAFLRGMNIGGRRIKNPELTAHVEALGFGAVACFRASGNVVFAPGGGEDDRALERRIEQGLREALGYAVPTYVRTAGELRAVAAYAPFDPERVAASKGKLQVAFLERAPSAKAAAEVLALATGEDLLDLDGTELYWLPSGGLLESPLDLKAIAKLLGDSTTRTKGTCELIAAKHFA